MQDPRDLEKKKSDKLEDAWESDQAERGYYYDDAHGYEEFDPESDEETDDESESEGCWSDD